MTMVRDLPGAERPRERLLCLGPEFLSNVELLAILLRSGYKEKSSMEVAQELLKENKEKGILALRDMSIAELMNIKGIGIAKATEIAASIELGKRMYISARGDIEVVNSPKDAAEYAMPRFRFQQREHFAIILLNIKNHILAMPIISIGSLTASVVHPREVFKEAIRHTAAAMILVHNHPSGDPTPSRDDEEVTRRLLQVGKIMDIPVLDHIILGNNKYVSLKEKGMIK